MHPFITNDHFHTVKSDCCTVRIMLVSLLSDLIRRTSGVMLTLGWHWKGDGGGKSHLSLSGLHLSEYLTLFSKIIIPSVNLTSTSRRRNTAEYTDLIMSITLQLLMETPQSFGRKRNFSLVFFTVLSEVPPPLLHICNGRLFTL